MKSKKVVLLVALLTVCAILLTGCGNTANDNKEKDLSSLKAVTNLVADNQEYSKHTNADGVSFSCPTNWVSVGEEGTFFYVAPDTTGTSVNLLSEEIGSMISLSGYVDIAKAKLPDSMDITSEIKQEEVNLNGRDAYIISYTAKQEEISMKVLQEVIKVDNTVYILTVGTILDNYTQVEETLNNVLSSLTK